MESIESFAVEVRLFERWLLEATDLQSDAAKEALVRLLALYAAALRLPPAWSPDLEHGKDAELLSDDEWHRALNASRRLPLDLYCEVFNPTVVDPDNNKSGVGSLSDDLADIYRDVVTGLRAYERGERAEAVWVWSFLLHSHWGAHATSAIRALHWWLVENDPEKLSGRREPAEGGS